MKAVAEELETLKNNLRTVIGAYSQRLESEIEDVRATVDKQSNRKKVPTAKLHDLRDMTTLLRKLAINPEKGRRKDLKKIDSLVGDLTLLVEKW